MIRSIVRVGVAAAALAFVAARPAAAQMGISFGATAGLTVPVGDLSDTHNSGFTLGGLMRVKPVLSPLGFRFDGGYSQFGGKDAVIGTNPNLNVWHLTANAELNLVPSGMLYGIGGAGFFSTSASGSNNSETDFGWNAGGGVKIPLTGFGAFVEARYTRINHGGGVNTSYVPIVFGITF